MNGLMNSKSEDKSEQLDLGEEFGNQYLTKRELDVLKCVIVGYSAKKIGHILKISSRTVEGYIHNLKTKLGCNNKAQIIFVAMKSGLINQLDVL